MAIKKNEVKVLRALCKDARRTLEDIGNETGLTGPGVGKIIDRLESSGVITGYMALPALEKIGFKIASFYIFRWDHSRGKTEELTEFLKKTKGVIFAAPVQGSTYTHIMISAHPTFSDLEEFLREFRTKWNGSIREESLLLMSPDRSTRELNFDLF